MLLDRSDVDPLATGRVVFRHKLSTASSSDPLVIEGVGGLMVPLDQTHTVLDWMLALKSPAFVPLLVVGSYLGTISHTLTTLDVMRRNDLAPRAIVVSESLSNPVPLEETVETIARFAKCDVRAVARGGEADLAGLFA